MSFLKKIPLKYYSITFSFLLVSFLSYSHASHNSELRAYDLLFKLRPSLSVNKDIAIIEISDDTLSAFAKAGRHWPFPRYFHADLIDVLKEYGAKAAVFDILFSEPTLSDARFSESVKSFGKVYFPVAFDLDAGTKGKGPVFKAQGLSAGIQDSLKSTSLGIGHINTFIDSDGKVRRVPLFISYKGKVTPQLSLKTAAGILGLNPDKVSLSLPLDSSGYFLINYPGKWVKTFSHYSYYRILKVYSDIKKGLKPKDSLDFLKDKICVIGMTAAGTTDLKPVPLESNYPMVGLIAGMLNSFLTKKFISPVSSAGNIFIALTILSLSLIICLNFTALKSLLLSLGLGAGYFLADYLLFDRGIYADLFLPLLVIILSYISVLVYRFFQESRRRQLLEKEIDIARQIQESFLPKIPETLPGIELTAFMKPAKFVAGDLYDIVDLGKGKTGILIGDVSGKGVPASLIMAQTISLFRVFARESLSPEEVFDKLNKELCLVLRGRFVTALYLIIDSEKGFLSACSAGHNPLIIVDSQGKAEEFMPSSGPPLGIMDFSEYEEFQRPLLETEKIAVYTDGVTEARNKSGEEFGIDLLKKNLSENSNLSGRGMSGKVIARLLSFAKGLSQYDDITLIIVTPLPTYEVGKGVNGIQGK